MNRKQKLFLGLTALIGLFAYAGIFSLDESLTYFEALYLVLIAYFVIACVVSLGICGAVAYDMLGD